MTSSPMLDIISLATRREKMIRRTCKAILHLLVQLDSILLSDFLREPTGSQQEVVRRSISDIVQRMKTLLNTELDNSRVNDQILDQSLMQLHAGGDMVDIATDHPALYIQYHRGMKELSRTLKRSFEDRDILVYIRWGVTGAGKTRYVWETEDRGDIFTVNLHDNVPFDGYNGESVLLFDDFNGHYEITSFLRWTDRYPLRVNVKGTYAYANWTKIYITSNINPIEWFIGTVEQHKQAFMRRVTNVTEVPLVIL
jgi:hypothetical protein